MEWHHLHQPPRGDVASGVRVQLRVLRQKNANQESRIEIFFRALTHERLRDCVRPHSVLRILPKNLRYAESLLAEWRRVRVDDRDGKLQQLARLHVFRM